MPLKGRFLRNPSLLCNYALQLCYSKTLFPRALLGRFSTVRITDIFQLFLFYFEQYGNIIEFEMPYDKVKKQRKGFGFITFEREETMKELIKRGKVTIGEHDVDLRKATPKTDFGGFGGGMGMMMGGGFRGGGGGGMGGGGGGGGGWGGPMDFYGGSAAGEKIIFHPRTIKHTAF